MQGVIIIGEPYGRSIFIEAIEFPDGTRRTSHFAEHHGMRQVNGHVVDKYVIYFDDDSNRPVILYKTQNGLWFLDD